MWHRTDRARIGRPYVRLLLTASCVITTGCAETMQIGAVTWQRSDEFSRRDRRAVVEAAKHAGFTEISRVSKRWHRPSDRHHALVESPQRVDGRRVTWRSLIVCGPVDRHHGYDIRGAHASIAVDGWTSSANGIRDEQRFRVADGEWQCDLHLGEGVTESAAELIVRAVRRQQLVNRTPHPDVFCSRRSAPHGVLAGRVRRTGVLC